MPLPSPREAGLRAGRQMQVEPCEIPFAGAPEVLRSEAYLNVRCNEPAPCLTRGRMRGTPQMGVFQQPVIERGDDGTDIPAKGDIQLRQVIHQRKRLSPFCKRDWRALQYLSQGSLRPPQGVGEKRLFEAEGFDVQRPRNTRLPRI